MTSYFILANTTFFTSLHLSLVCECSNQICLVAIVPTVPEMVPGHVNRYPY